MMYYAIKILTSALLITAISELAKRHSGVASTAGVAAAAYFALLPLLRRFGVHL